MKKYFFLFFIIIFSLNSFLDTEVEEFVNSQHNKIFNFLNNNQDLFDSDKDRFLNEFEVRFSRLIPPEEISKRVMGKRLFTAATKKQILKWVLDNYPDFEIKYTHKGNPKPKYFDIADAIVVAKAGLA
mgnify:CR=1 FL=1